MSKQTSKRPWPRLQVVWWRSPSDWWVKYRRYEFPWLHIYKWSMQVGPLEIRRWV